MPRGTILITLVALAACGTSGASDDGPLVQVGEASSQNGTYEVVMFAHMSNVTRGNHSMQLDVTSASDGSPAMGLTLAVVPWMPAMGHGASIKPTVTELGDGAYQIDDVDLFMAGLWELRTTIEPTDYVAPSLQVR
ncbi:MAG TPA: FixH family protein [Kofleriaceae bacterium]|nr:FixH family protein [Kofleriaceae bacterium]